MPLVVPTGSPAWTRATGFGFYGGNVNKENYLQRGPIDALTDLGAEDFSRMVADLAACARSAHFGVITHICNDSSPAAPTVEFCSLMTGVRLTSYAGGSPPAGFPSAARNGNGDVTFTFAASYADEYGVVGAYTPRDPTGNLVGTAAGQPVFVVSGSTVRIRAFDGGGAAISDARVSWLIY